MRIRASELRVGDLIRTSPLMRVQHVERHGLRVIVSDGEREREYLMCEHIGIVRRGPDDGAGVER